MAEALTPRPSCGPVDHLSPALLGTTIGQAGNRQPSSASPRYIAIDSYTRTLEAYGQSASSASASSRLAADTIE